MPGRVDRIRVPVAAKGWGRPLLLVLGGIGALLLAHSLGQHTDVGRALDRTVEAAVLGQPGLGRFLVVRTLYVFVSLPTLVLVFAGLTVRALISAHRARAVAGAILVGGSTVTTRVLKHVVFERPADDGGPAFGNGLPSGHVTGAMAICLAALVVLCPRREWVLTGSLVTVYAALTTLWGGTHRPVDVVAAVGVCAAWSGVSLMILRVNFPSGWARGDVGGEHRRSMPHVESGLWPRCLAGSFAPAGLLLAQLMCVRPPGLFAAVIFVFSITGLIAVTVGVTARHLQQYLQE